MDLDPAAALRKAQARVDEQRIKLAGVPTSDPRRSTEEQVLETLRQSAALAKMACLLLGDELTSDDKVH